MKKNKFPKSVTILGRKWVIKQVIRPTHNGEPCLGLCDFDGKIIYLEKEQDDDLKFLTLVHEAAHAWMILCGIDQRLSDSENEVYCQLISAFVEDIVRSFN